jgi:NAD(P)-dependent dehydrogenase (short-subunit alcohol dehydrogenase family)
MNPVALITGGSRGLGRAFAFALAKNGMRVAVASRRADDLEDTLVALRAAGADAVAIPTDVTDPAAVRNMVSVAENKLGPIDLLINSAGVATPVGPSWEINSNDWWRNIEVNLRGPMLCANAVIPGMIRRRRGRIVNIASGADAASFPYMSAYVTAKAALIRFTEVLADELRQHGVSVFAIQPGTVGTAMLEELVKSDAGYC